MSRTKSLTLVLSLACAAVSTHAADAPAHFDPQGKPPSTFTLELRDGVKAQLPFAGKRDFDEAGRGFIAKPSYTQIKADAGHVAWDMGSYRWLLQGQEFPSIHPSLQRQAVLNMAYGLYEVVPGRIHQVRGYDLSNVSFIKGDTGWIVFDPLTTKETARAALEFINEKLGKRPVVGVVCSHWHGDHFGGVRGVVDEADVANGKVMVIAGEGFMGAAISENVFAGNAMTRRLQWQYAVMLPRSPFGHVDQAIGKNVANGNLGLIAPNRLVSKGIVEITLDGVQTVFQNAPDTEAPVEMNTCFPQFKALWSSEVVTGTIHNISTLRGAAVRNAINWSKEINEALYMFGGDVEVMFNSRSWPRWGNARIQEVLRTQRDAYANLNNQTLHYVNQGVTINEIHSVYDVPQSLQQSWAVRSYHGDVRNNVRGVVNRFLGRFDGNPANPVPLSPSDSAPLYVEMMGGSEEIIGRSRELVAQGKYLHASEILNRLLFAEPKNQPARQVRADTYEQLGYPIESTSVRNTFLQGAFELRNGLPGGLPLRSTGPDVVRAMTTGQWLDFLGISLDPKKAQGLHYTMNLVTPDNGEQYAVELNNATLTSIEGFQVPKPDLTMTLDRAALNRVMMGVATFDQLAVEGKARLDGDSSVIHKLLDLMVRFTPDFEILPGTAPTQRQVPPGRPSSLPETNTLIHPESFDGLSQVAAGRTCGVHIVRDDDTAAVAVGRGDWHQTVFRNGMGAMIEGDHWSSPGAFTCENLVGCMTMQRDRAQPGDAAGQQGALRIARQRRRLRRRSRVARVNQVQVPELPAFRLVRQLPRHRLRPRGCAGPQLPARHERIANPRDDRVATWFRRRIDRNHVEARPQAPQFAPRQQQVTRRE